jgi:hypothetical protein
MLHITHCQTTAYHPESNGIVKRLQCHLKDAICARTAAATWVLLGLRAQPREDTGLSLAEAVFGAPTVLLNEFLKGDEIPVDTISKIFLSLWSSCFSLAQAQFESPAAQRAPHRSPHLGLAQRNGSPFHPLYNGPTPSSAGDPAPSPSRSGSERRSSP